MHKNYTFVPKFKRKRMKKLLIIALSFSALGSVFGQETVAPAEDTIPSNWKLKALYGINGTQSSFVNWNAGGRNNISVLGFISASALYEKDRMKWDNDLSLALGGLQYLDNQGDGLQKTDDRIELNTSLGYKLKEHYYLSLQGGFRTQSLDGFSANNDSVRASTFMAPAYASLALGIDYTPNDNFSAFLSPFGAKMTFVNDQVLSNAGAFGVEGAEYNSLGEVVTAGKRFRGEFGAYFRMKYNKELVKNIQMKSKLELFSNYLNNPENIDVNAEVLFTFKVNSWFSASLNWNLIYDDDIDIEDRDGNVGPRTQFKSVLGLGVSYTMQNYKDEKK